MSSFVVRSSNVCQRKVNRPFTLTAPRPRTLRASRIAIVRVSAVDQTEIQSKVVGIISEQLAKDKDSVTLESEFAQLGADSLDVVEIMMALEEEFKVEFDQENTPQIESVQGVVDYIIEKMEAQ
eukprot:TRINITY_DN309_c0_g1_i1.p2 TRINITY_DN309_c0_g1~~TRINITY_DN309_c0_g1_i1.p2  ORF type:complete len:124 (+),score=16.75 TRINITY_DN309_c0_g1_i1:77-448(+)